MPNPSIHRVEILAFPNVQILDVTRMFAMARTAAKYGERLVGHKAALLDQVSRRAALFSAMAAAPKVRSAGWQLGDQDRLADFIDDVENLDFARLRAPRHWHAGHGAHIHKQGIW